MNINQTREMVRDFRKKMPSQPLKIRGQVVKEDYKYLDWNSKTDAVYNKGLSRLYLLRKDHSR